MRAFLLADTTSIAWSRATRNLGLAHWAARVDRGCDTVSHLYSCGNAAAYAVASYQKMPANAVALRAPLGAETFMKAYRAVRIDWLRISQHPTEYDFFGNHDQRRQQARSLVVLADVCSGETWTLDQRNHRRAGSRGQRDDHDRGSRTRPDARQARHHSTRRVSGGSGELAGNPGGRVFPRRAPRNTLRVAASPSDREAWKS